MAASDICAGREERASLTFRGQFSSAQTTGSLLDCWSVAFENVRPVRTPTAYKGQRNFAGLWWCATNRRHVGFESWCERDHLMCLDFDRAVIGVSSQPFRISLPNSLPQRSHVPDYFVRRSDGTAVVVDVRPDDRINEADQNIFDATAELCGSVGWGYRRLGSLPNVYLANVRWLAGYRNPRCARDAESARSLDALGSDRRVSIAELIREVGDPVTVIPSLFHHLWKQRIGADLKNRPLHLNSIVWPLGTP